MNSVRSVTKSKLIMRIIIVKIDQCAANLDKFFDYFWINVSSEAICSDHTLKALHQAFTGPQKSSF